ncbi:nitrile hydratase subunit alpha [Xanthobacter sp. KR7-65]|uniref:nitrile hydratase subunit alpha n=1 Tax=Xanthobacter sp. KR7-65 TaxID=3156612 RepID=UPI0032B557AD
MREPTLPDPAALDRVPVREGYDGADYYALMTRALHQILLEQGLLAPEDTDRVIAALEAPRPEWGARLVARAWVDPAFKARLLADGSAAAAELGFTIKEARLVAVENTADLHNLIVCTLCSCYPRSLLGQPPWWYISKAYRARAVREPRAVLKEFGVDLPDSVRVRVHDSNADMRYLVLPRRPEGTDGADEADLARFVTRDSMIGTAHADIRAGLAKPA